MTVTRLIYTAAGAPEMPGVTPGVCRACGQPGIGTPFSSWVRPTFTDHDKLAPGEITCHACDFCFTDRNEALALRVGKDAPQRMRNYSHFVCAGEWTPLSKGNKRRMREILLGAPSPEVAVIADSGQKHIIFRARPGWWQFEELAMPPRPRALESLLAIVEQLYSGGFSKTEIESGRYIQKRILSFGLTAWSELESGIKPSRGTALLSLALYLAQKDDDGPTDDSGQAALPGFQGNA